MPKRVLVTGNLGYIGSVLTPMLVERGYDVVGLDTCYFRDCTLDSDRSDVPVIDKDLRDLEPSDVGGFDGVIHLGALSNDPIGNLSEQWTEEINLKASVRLAELAKAAGTPRFLFSSSCIMYGMSENALVDETSPLAPNTIYATSKVRAEQEISRFADANFGPTFLRNGTVYGFSPRMRFDTVLNNFMGSAFTTGKVVVFSDGTPWRPVVHVEDVANAFITLLEAPFDVVGNQAFNVGVDHVNSQIGYLAETAAKVVPGATVEYKSTPDADQRTYKTDFSKIKRMVPDFRFSWTVEEGARSLYEAFTKIGLTEEQFRGDKFTRLSWLQKLITDGQLDSDLRWKQESKMKVSA